MAAEQLIERELNLDSLNEAYKLVTDFKKNNNVDSIQTSEVILFRLIKLLNISVEDLAAKKNISIEEYKSSLVNNAAFAVIKFKGTEVKVTNAVKVNEIRLISKPLVIYMYIHDKDGEEIT